MVPILTREADRAVMAVTVDRDHASDAHPVEALATLIDKDIGPLDPVSLLLPLLGKIIMARLSPCQRCAPPTAPRLRPRLALRQNPF
jgi:hypothetical protein